MKKICSLFLVVLITLTIFAQSPQSFNYQAIARDATGNIFSNTQIVIGIRIIQGSANGEAVLNEEYTKTTNAFGLINLEIGSQNPTAFSAINWTDGPFFVEVSVNDVLMGTSQLLSVPYSQYAEKAGNGLTVDDAIKLESIQQGAEVNVNADWNATSGDSQILNKPTLIGYGNEADPIFTSWNKSTGINITASQISDFQTSVTNNSAVLANTAKISYPSTDATKLAGIAAGAEVNVNADWNATSGDAQILNKPTISVVDGSETKVTAGTNITVSGTGTAASPYIVNSNTGTGGFVHYIGELFGGGIIVAVWKAGGVEKGLIASLVDMKTSTNSYYMAWSGNTTTIIGLNAQSPINGQTNTNAIIAQSSIADKAATVCNIYSITDGTGTYNDWYLPAVWELNQCYNAAFIVNTILGSINGFQFDYYWSSTETYDNYVGFQYFDYGSTYYDYKTSEYRVRAVRRF